MNKLVKFTATLLLSVTFSNAESTQFDAKALVEKGVEFCFRDLNESGNKMIDSILTLIKSK